MDQSHGPITKASNNEVHSIKVTYVTDFNPPVTYYEEPGELTPTLASMNNFGNMFAENSANQNNMAGAPRLAPSPMQAQQVQTNGNGAGMNGMNVGMPMSAGQQMDVNMLMQKVLELSEVLKENREKTAGIIAGAEELAVSMSIDPKWEWFDRDLKALSGILIQR